MYLFSKVLVKYYNYNYQIWCFYKNFSVYNVYKNVKKNQIKIISCDADF
jgi:hypothetical protein